MAAPFVIYRNIPDIAGWRKDEIYLILSFLFIAEGLCSVLFEGIWQMPGMVFDGKFDCILTRPVSPLFQVLSYGMGLQGISVFLVGLIRLGLCGLRGIGLSLFFILSGTLLCMSIYLMGNCVVFWFDAGGRTTLPYTMSQIGQYARYPLEIYPGIMQKFVMSFTIGKGADMRNVFRMRKRLEGWRKLCLFMIKSPGSFFDGDWKKEKYNKSVRPRGRWEKMPF